MHRKHAVTFYVQAIETDRVEVATAKGKSRQWVSIADWLNNAAATCDRPICERCAVEVGVDLHRCPEHAKGERTA